MDNITQGLGHLLEIYRTDKESEEKANKIPPNYSKSNQIKTSLPSSYLIKLRQLKLDNYLKGLLQGIIQLRRLHKINLKFYQKSSLIKRSNSRRSKNKIASQ